MTGLTMRVLLDDDEFAQKYRHLADLIDEQNRRIAELKRLWLVKHALVEYEVKRRIVDVLARHDGLLKTRLVTELGLERSTRFFEAQLAFLTRPYVRLTRSGRSGPLVETTKEPHPDARGHLRQQRVYRLSDTARAMSPRELEEALGRPDLPPARKFRVIDGGRS